MRLYAWLAGFALVVFGVGWTARALSDRVVHPAQAPSTCQRCADAPKPERKDPRLRGLENVQSFAQELGLDEQQKTALQTLIDSTAQRVRDHERQIHDIYRSSMGDVRDVLTAAQQTRLDELVAAKFSERRESTLREVSAWIQRQFNPGDDRLKVIAVILRNYEEEKSRFGSDRHDDDKRGGSKGERHGGEPRGDRNRGDRDREDAEDGRDRDDRDRDRDDRDRDRDDRWEQYRSFVRELRTKTEARLVEYLDAGQIEQLWSFLDAQRRRRPR